VSELTEDGIHSFTYLSDIGGTGETFSVPIVYRFLVRYLSPIVRFIFNIRYTGLERLPKSGAMILTSNHVSNLDPIFKILAARREVFYLAKEGHFQKQPNRFIMRSNGMIETMRSEGGKDALSRAHDVLNSGFALGIFPEGTRSRNVEPPYIQRGKTGVARLAASFPNIPVFPISIIGSRDVMPPGANFIRFWKRIDIHIGESITFGEWLSSPEGGNFSESQLKSLISIDEHGRASIMKSLYRRFTDQLMGTIEEMGAP
jgi:1-acyl-sn-glycerol-3-phosphate acyltransferase